ncbi:MAG TPA: DUF1801 domain-containing protein [Streptosporangiaceae bacterium]|nr:DUF1801 domain-containing protein [Streptosporangiaceae bacterium]
MAEQFRTIDEYIGTFPEQVQTVLQEIRRTIRSAVPEASETISYRIPTMTLNGRLLVSFAGWKRHVSLYPVPAGDPAFGQEIAPYLAGKGTVKFPLDKPVPCGLVGQLVTHLARERHSNLR